MSTAKSMQSDSNSNSIRGNSTHDAANDLNVGDWHRQHSTLDRYGFFPECSYSVWNIFIGVFLLFTTIFQSHGDVASIVAQCFAVVFVFVGLLAFVLIFKSARSIFILLTVFSAITILLTFLTILGFVFAVEGSVPVPEIMRQNIFLEIVLIILLIFHIIFNSFCFYVFFKRSCKNQVTLESEHNERMHGVKTPEMDSEIIVMDY